MGISKFNDEAPKATGTFETDSATVKNTYASDMHMVELPPTIDGYVRGPNGLTSEIRQPVQAHQNRKAPFMVDRADAPTPYPCMAARFTVSYLNTITLQCIGLAICVALFSKLLTVALEMSSSSLAQSCSSVAGTGMLSLVTDSVRSQAYNGVNATLWNLQQASVSSAQSVASSYANALASICEARNNAASNATESMANWTALALHQAENTTETLFKSLEDVERALEKSGYFSGMTGNISKAFDFKIPNGSAQLNCSNWRSGNFTNTSVIAVVDGTMKTLQAAQSQVALIMKVPIPQFNSTPYSSTGDASHDEDFGVGKPTKIWILLFSLVAGLAVVPVGYREYLLWHYQLATLKKSLSFDPLEDFHEMLHYTGTSFSKAASHVIIRSGHYSRQVYVRWALNYAFSSNLNRLLKLSIFLGIYGIANSTIIASVRLSQAGVSSCDSWLRHNNATYTEFQGALNSKLFGVLSQALGDLSVKQAQLVQSLQMATGLQLNTSWPYESGVALEKVTLPKLQGWHQRVEDFEGNSRILDLLRSVNSAIWISSITTLAIWLISAGCACIWATIKIRNIPDNYGRHGTPMSRL